MRAPLNAALFAAAAALALAAGGVAAAELVSPGGTNWDGRPAPPLAGSTMTTTTTTTTVYPSGTAVMPPVGYTPNSPSDYSVPDRGDSGVSPRAGQMATGSHCPPGTTDCGGDNH